MTHLLQDTIQGLTIRFLVRISEARQIGISTYKKLDALSAIFTMNSATSVNVAISVEEYAWLLGARDKKAVHTNIKRDLALLSSLRLSYTSKNKGGNHIRDAPILASYKIRNGIVHATLSDEFSSVLKKGSVMQCPALLWQIHPGRNLHSYFLLRRLAEHKRMNRNALNADRLGIRTI